MKNFVSNFTCDGSDNANNKHFKNKEGEEIICCYGSRNFFKKHNQTFMLQK